MRPRNHIAIHSAYSAGPKLLSADSRTGIEKTLGVVAPETYDVAPRTNRVTPSIPIGANSTTATIPRNPPTAAAINHACFLSSAVFARQTTAIQTATVNGKSAGCANDES